jgi:hypothetical protein
MSNRANCILLVSVVKLHHGGQGATACARAMTEVPSKYKCKLRLLLQSLLTVMHVHVLQAIAHCSGGERTDQ